MVSVRASGVAALALAVVASLGGCAAAGSSASVRPDSGIRGQVLLGPTCAAQPADDACVRPYQAAISIRREPSGGLVTQLRSSRAGTFTVALAPGRYQLVGSSGHVYPRGAPRTVIVPAHRYLRVTIFFDSGIRHAVRPVGGNS